MVKRSLRGGYQVGGSLDIFGPGPRENTFSRLIVPKISCHAPGNLPDHNSGKLAVLTIIYSSNKDFHPVLPHVIKAVKTGTYAVWVL
jgi:hypothetical protein